MSKPTKHSGYRKERRSHIAKHRLHTSVATAAPSFDQREPKDFWRNPLDQVVSVFEVTTSAYPRVGHDGASQALEMMCLLRRRVGGCR